MIEEKYQMNNKLLLLGIYSYLLYYLESKEIDV